MRKEQATRNHHPATTTTHSIAVPACDVWREAGAVLDSTESIEPLGVLPALEGVDSIARRYELTRTGPWPEPEPEPPAEMPSSAAASAFHCSRGVAPALVGFLKDLCAATFALAAVLASSESDEPAEPPVYAAQTRGEGCEEEEEECE